MNKKGKSKRIYRAKTYRQRHTIATTRKACVHHRLLLLYMLLAMHKSARRT